MKILVDTNILINLEDNKIIDSNFSKFYKLAISNNCTILFHPNAIPDDLKRDRNQDRKKIILSKLNKYQQLQNPRNLESDFLKSKSILNENDISDNQQIYQLFRGYVDLFITEDRGIHKKSKSLGIEGKTLGIIDAVQFLENNFRIVIPLHPILEHKSIRALEDDFDSPFFDSLKNDYGQIEFPKWLNKCIKENRPCYYVKSENKILALLIYNEEKTENHQLPDIYERVIKICTMKVSDSLFGLKIGELFLQKMFEFCISQSIHYLYLTVYSKQIQLILLLNKFGFKEQKFINKQGNEEIRMLKILDKKQMVDNLNASSNHPFYFDNSSVNKYVIPIQPKYYSKLFKDGQLRVPTLFDQFQDSINEIQGNSILKAYISSSNQINLKQGDILLFYASKHNKVIEPIGILKKFGYS